MVFLGARMRSVVRNFQAGLQDWVVEAEVTT